jgi:hypothetical protein
MTNETDNLIAARRARVELAKQAVAQAESEVAAAEGEVAFAADALEDANSDSEAPWRPPAGPTLSRTWSGRRWSIRSCCAAPASN